MLLWGIAAALLFGAIFIPRFYCRYACPLGAALGAWVLKLRRDEAAADVAMRFPAGSHVGSYLHLLLEKLDFRGDVEPRVLEHSAQIATRFGIEDGDPVEIESAFGRIAVPAARVSDEMMPGSVALPHGWGHAGNWSRAVALGGAGYNELTSNSVVSTDLPSGNASVNGIAVRIRTLRSVEAAA